MWTAELEGVEDVQRAWAAALADIAHGLTTGVERGVTEGAAQARTQHPYQDRTGELTGSIEGYLDAAASPQGGEAVGYLNAKKRYASFVEAGTAPHVIVPSRARVLRWEDDAGVHFARRVQHPGNPQLPFMGPALQKAERVVVAEVELAIARAAERFR